MAVRFGSWHVGWLKSFLLGAALSSALGFAAPQATSVPSARQSTASAPRVNVTAHGISYAYATSNELPHGVAGDHRLVFIAVPLTPEVRVLDRFTGRTLATLPAPPGGFILPFALRVPRDGRLVVLDAGGFPSPFVVSVPRVYDYDYQFNPRTGVFTASVVRTVGFAGLPIVFTEDVEVLSDSLYVVSESIVGALWLIQANGSVVPGIVPSNPAVPLPQLGPCPFPTVDVGGIPFGIGFGPGVGSLASRDGQLYFKSTCLGGVYRVPVATLTDASRTPDARAADIRTVSAPVPGGPDVLEGLVFNRFNPRDRYLYAGDPLRLRLVRIDPETGSRQVVGDDPLLFNFSVALAFLPPVFGLSPLVVVSDQEYRFAAFNPALTQDVFQLPFIITKVYPFP